MRHTIIVHNHYAAHAFRTRAAKSHRHGQQVLFMHHLAARLAGGFKAPINPETAIVWGLAYALASVPRRYARLIGFTTHGWPRRAHEDALLAEHIIAAAELDPLPVHEADQHDFDTLRKTTAKVMVCTYARRDTEGRESGVSPLYQELCRKLKFQEQKRYLTDTPEHASNPGDRLFARRVPITRRACPPCAVTPSE